MITSVRFSLVSATKYFLDFMKFSVGVRYRKLSSESEFHENRLINGRILLKGADKFTRVFLVFLIDMGEIWRRRFPLSVLGRL